MKLPVWKVIVECDGLRVFEEEVDPAWAETVMKRTDHHKIDGELVALVLKIRKKLQRRESVSPADD